MSAPRPRIIHVTDAAASGVLAAVTALARAQAENADVDVTLAFTRRSDSPPHAVIRRMVGPHVRLVCWARTPRLAVPALVAHLPHVLRGRGQTVVHLHSSRAGFLGRLLAAPLGRRTRVVYSPHSFAFDRVGISPVQRTGLLVLERVAASAAPALIAVSHAEAELAHRSIPAAHVATVRNRVDLERLRTIARRQWAQNAAAQPTAGEGAAFSDPVDLASGHRRTPLRVIHVGRIVPQKRPDAFARIAATIARDHPDLPVEFRWVGDGQRDLLDVPGAHIHVTGWREADEVLRELSRADLLLFTSAGEGLPMAALEARALGLPVVAHDVTGLRDAITPGRSGLLGDTDADLTAAVVDLLRNADRRDDMARAARALADASERPADLARESLDAYRTLGCLGKQTQP